MRRWVIALGCAGAAVFCSVAAAVGFVAMPIHPVLELTLENRRETPVCAVVVDTGVEDGRAVIETIRAHGVEHVTLEVHAHRHLSVAVDDCRGSVVSSTFDPYFLAHEGFPDVFTVVFAADGHTRLLGGGREESIEDRHLALRPATDVDGGLSP